MRVLSFGEVLWDIIEKKEYLGGAPFNLAVHLARLDCHSSIVTRVGKDQRGDAILAEMRKGSS